MKKTLACLAFIFLCVLQFSGSTLTAQRLEMVVDASSTGEPINKFIYGQFIEHLGRCIYGGIWAEMLEDRKFYFPITADYDPYRESRGLAKDALLPAVGASPWQIMGAADSVTMDVADSFVGEHTPLVSSGSGIRQNDLGLVKGKSYEGYIWLKSRSGPSTVTVTLTGSGKGVRVDRVGTVYKKYPLRFSTGESTLKGSLEIAVEGSDCYVGTVSLMPEDNIGGLRADTLKLLQQLNSPMYRWPGGNFVSGYDWRDGIGDRDRRPPRKNPAWTGVEHNDFGLDEFMAFCREVKAEPLVTVNLGFGDPYSAAQEVEYANGSDSTIGGGWRVKNGHSEPYGVKWWCIGNEMYGRWQLGHMQLGHYTLKHNQAADYMLGADPSIKLIAVGALGWLDKQNPEEKRTWSEAMLQESGEKMNLISEHFYSRNQPDDMVAHIAQITNRIKEKAEGHRKLRQQIPTLAGKDIRIAMDEWNYWYQPYVYGELGCIYRLRDALGIAAGIHEYARNSDIISMAHYAQTVNVIGCIKTTKTDAAFATTALPLMLYRNHFGSIPLKVEGGVWDAKLDVAAAWTQDRKTVTVGVVNPHLTEQSIELKVRGARLGNKATVWFIAGDTPDPSLFNEPGKEPEVQIRQKEIDKLGGQLVVPPLSVSLFRIPAVADSK